MSAGRGGRGGRGGHEEEHENHERWLVSYADMMTLLMVLFIVMFAISQVDQHKFAALKDGLASGFGATTNMPLSGGQGITENDGVVPAPVNFDVGIAVKQSTSGGTAQDGEQTANSSSPGKTQSATQAAAVKELRNLAEIERKIRAALRSKGLENDVRFKVTERGLVVALISDDVFFENASATLRPRGVAVLQAVAPTVRSLPNAVAVEGHANRLALVNSIYPTNWELSGARAAGVVRWLAGNGGLRETRLSATGYGSSRPLYAASDVRSIRFNRRVDLVLLSNQSPEVRALLPRMAGSLSNL